MGGKNQIAADAVDDARPPPDKKAAPARSGAEAACGKPKQKNSSSRAISAQRGRGDELFKLARGNDVAATKADEGFEPELVLSRDELIDLFTTHEVRKNKDGTYITRPMTKGDRSRSDANAGEWRLVPIDIDELQPDEQPMLEQWFEDSGFEGFISTTFSHKEDRPKIRLMLISSRPTTSAEHAYIHRALESMVPFKIDPCMAKPSQPIFLPACPPENKHAAFARYQKGAPLDIGRLLSAYKKEMEEEAQRRAQAGTDARGIGVRQPGGLIEWFNENYDLPALLVLHGYKGRGNRYIAPGSKSRRAAAVVYEGKRVVSHHDPAHDKLALRNKQQQPIVLDAFAAYCALEHQNDFKRAFAGALDIAKAAGYENQGPKVAMVIREPKAARDLMRKKFDSLRWTIEQILPEGCYLLSARPKEGKSWMALQFCGAVVTQGGMALSKRAIYGDALYLANEDNERRFQARIEKHQIEQFGDIDRFFYDTGWPRIGEGGEEALEHWLKTHPDARLVVVDSLETIRPRRSRNGSVYADDYAATQALKALSDQYKVTILIICHNKKGKSESGDPLELISASLGLSGGCDGALILERPRGSSDAKFYVIGRDIEHEPDDGYMIRFDRASCKWEMLGDAGALAGTAAQRGVIEAIRDAGKALNAAEVGRATGRSRQAARHILNQLADSGRLVEIEGSSPLEYALPAGIEA